MFEAAVLGVSAGGMHALKSVISPLPVDFPMPLAIVQHMDAQSDTYLAEYLNGLGAITVKEAEDKEPLLGGTVYLAPAGYHLLIEPDRSFSLSVDEKVNFSRPSIDLLFESAADAFGDHLIGIMLTGANADGALGLQCIARRGGIAIVQNPLAAEASYMPRAALAAVPGARVAELGDIASLLLELCHGGSHGAAQRG